MQDIYKNSLLLIHSITRLCGVCHKYYEDPNDENGERLMKMVDESERKFLQVKESIVKMVRKVEKVAQPTDKEIPAVKTEGGFLISKELKNEPKND